MLIKKWILLGVSVLSVLSLPAFSMQSATTASTSQKASNDITAIIHKNTTQEELEDLQAFFAENAIDLIIKNIQFNDDQEITSLHIILQKGTTQSTYNSASNTPIHKLELGFKNGNLYITNSGMFDITSWKNQHHFPAHGFSVDSLFQHTPFKLDFDIFHQGDSLAINGIHMNIDQLKEQLLEAFQLQEDAHGQLAFNGQQFPSHFKKAKKFQFIDDPTIQKLIIIDGTIADFEQLDQLANNDQLDTVDFLSPKTAMSIYGDQAKDGAIIATTKEE